MNKNLAIICFLGMLTIALGAFGAHGLKDTLSPDLMRSFETGVRYQMYHIIVLLFINIYDGFSLSFKNLLTTIFLIGILFFSGSIYAITIVGVSVKSIWFITPLGGLLFVVGWGMMCYQFLRKNRS